MRLFQGLLKRLIIFLPLISSLTIFGQTGLFVIGTVHEPTRNFNSDSIFSILLRLKPDLILLEFDSSFFTADFKFRNQIRSNETQGTKKYMAMHSAMVRPYDIKGRSALRDLIKIESESIDRIRLIRNSMTPVQKQLFDDFDKSTNEMISFINKKPSEINQKYVYDLTEKNQRLAYQGLLEILDSRKDFEDILVGYRQSGVFNQWRNKRMAENALNFLKLEAFKNKTIVLFTGFLHKFYLLQEFIPRQQQYGFIVKEYYE